MKIPDKLRTAGHRQIKRISRLIRSRFVSKYEAEISFWKNRLDIDNGVFKNSHYRRVMLAMAQESTEEFLRGKVVADFGCGPRGSLVWASPALLRIGIDVLCDRYFEEFKESMVSHGMVYVKCTERVIPLPSNCVDVMFTLNAIDHVDHLSEMFTEIVRVIKPDGCFVGSFNLEEPPSRCEPQQLSQKTITQNLLDTLEVQSCRVRKKGPKDDPYALFFSGNSSYKAGEEGFLWVRATKVK